MPLKLGGVISAKRREKGWTQEQLAGAVGVSTPAVSKWETGATYPDVALLAPIARALGITMDELFAFESQLSESQVEKLAEEAAQIYKSEGFDAGWSFCEQMIKEYPGSIPLKYHLGSLFQSFLILKPGVNAQAIQSCYQKAASLYEEVLASADAKYSHASTLILVGYCTMLGKLDRAEELLDTLPKTKADPEQLYPSLCALRGRHEEAIRQTQENIRRYLPRISQALSVLCAYAREQGDPHRALMLATVNHETAQKFGIKTEAAYPDMIKSLIAKGDRAAALSFLEEYAGSVLHWSGDIPNNPIFDRLTSPPADAEQVRKMLAQAICMDAEFMALKEEPRYVQVIQKLRGLTGA